MMEFEQHEGGRLRGTARVLGKIAGYTVLAGSTLTAVGVGVGEVFFRDQFSKSLEIITGSDSPDLPPSSSDADPGSTTLVCFYEAPNCDESNDLATLRGGGNQVPVALSDATLGIEKVTRFIEDDRFYDRVG